MSREGRHLGRWKPCTQAQHAKLYSDLNFCISGTPGGEGGGADLNTLVLRRWSQTVQSSSLTRAVSRRGVHTALVYPTPAGGFQYNREESKQKQREKNNVKDSNQAIVTEKTTITINWQREFSRQNAFSVKRLYRAAVTVGMC